ncbi:MAG TPA: nucleotidyltransferase domain-containing protein [Planctomycetota bacterium]|nr:nucleotidyltransferase domain-containing protein [Planctomycetota bacterium]
MHPSISAKRDRVIEICRRHHVQRLDVFGSATGVEFDPQRSDVDLIVQFDGNAQEKLLDAYFGLKEELEALFDRPVDLLTTATVRNPYLRESIERSRQTLYAA